MMKKQYGVIGYGGKIGSLLVQRPNFVPIGCDITDLKEVEALGDHIRKKMKLDVIVNCAAISSISECERDYERAIAVNVHGLTNLHRVFGDRVLNISTEQVFSGKEDFTPSEDSDPDPINEYGMTKLAAESVSAVWGGKTIRLSRTVGITDPDISSYLFNLGNENQITVPDFFTRSYIHREFVADGIEYMVENWDRMPNLVHYSGAEVISMFSFVKKLAIAVGNDPKNVERRSQYDSSISPRPMRGGLNISLAQSLGFPIYDISDTVSKLAEDYVS